MYETSSGILIKNFIQNFKAIPRFSDARTFSVGTVGAVLACTGPALIVITAAQNGNLLPEQTISWLFGVYFFGGLIGIILPLLLGIPMGGAYSIPGAVLMTQATAQFSFSELVGAYLIAGLIILVIGYLGWFDKLLTWLPLELVMAVLAGSMISFATEMVKSAVLLPLIGGSTILAYFLFSKYIKKVPPVVGAIIVSLTSFFMFGESITVPTLSFELPTIWMPEFSLSAILTVSIPLTIMLLGTEGAQGITILKNTGYDPPVNLITMVNGIGTMTAGIFGGHSACNAGLITALCASPDVGPKEGRYVGAIVSGVIMCVFGFFASVVLDLILLMPQALVKIIAGLALINVLLNSLQRSFNGSKFQLGAFFTLAIAMSGIKFFGISSAFWALVGGWLISWFLEPQDFKQRLLKSSAP